MKITKYILSLAAAIGLAAGCQKAEMVQMLPMDEVVAPVLSKLPEKIVITPLNMTTDSVVFNWTSADFGVKTQVNYSIEVAEKGGAVKAIVSSGITDTTAVLYYETINSALYESLELLDGTATDVEFSVSAYTGESAKVYSNAVPVNATCTAAEKQYPKMTVVGAYQGWTPGAAQYVYDFKGTDEAYSGLIGFGINDFDMTKNEFKITGTDWGADNGEHSIPEGTEVEPEAAQIPLVNGGGSNILAYQTYKFYHLTFDKKTPALKKNFAFNTVGVIGVNGDWDNDVEMSFHVAKQRFYADIELTADGNFKFRADKGWDLNWGVKDGVVTAGGDNIEAKAGKYRVYLNLNNPENITYELNAKAYGIVEGEATPDTPAEPETPVLSGWGLVGTMTEWADGADIMMDNDGTWYVAKGVEFGAEDKFKIRKDGSWDVSFGGEFAADKEVTLTSENGPDIVPAAGKYDIYFNPETGKAWFITDGSYPGGGVAPTQSAWSMIGEFNSWGGDYAMFVEGDFHVAKGFTLAADGKVKFRKDAQWNYKGEDGNDVQTNLGGAAFAVDAELPLTAGGADLIVTAGTYDVYLKVSTDENGAFVGTAYFMTDGKTPEGAGAAPEVPETPAPEVTESAIAADVTALEENSIYGVIGINGDWNNDTMMKATTDANVFVAAGIEFTANGSFKVRKAGEWDDTENYGLENAAASALAINKGYTVITSGGSNDLKVPAGTYDIWFHHEKLQVYIMEAGKHPSTATSGTVEAPTATAWYLVGNFNGSSPNPESGLMTKEGEYYTLKGVAADGQWMQFTNGTWDMKLSGTFADGTAGFPVNAGVYEGFVAPAGTYDVYLKVASDFKSGTAYFLTPGTTPAN